MHLINTSILYVIVSLTIMERKNILFGIYDLFHKTKKSRKCHKLSEFNNQKLGNLGENLGENKIIRTPETKSFENYRIIEERKVP